MMQYPPSTRISEPVMKREASLARNTIAPCVRKANRKKVIWGRNSETEETHGKVLGLAHAAHGRQALPRLLELGVVREDRLREFREHVAGAVTRTGN